MKKNAIKIHKYFEKKIPHHSSRQFLDILEKFQKTIILVFRQILKTGFPKLHFLFMILAYSCYMCGKGFKMNWSLKVNENMVMAS